MQTDSFMCLSPPAKPTFQRRYLVNRCLCRNLIQTLRSLHCDLVYFCFLKSHQCHRWLPGLLSPGRETGNVPARKDLFSMRQEPEGSPHTKHSGVTAPGNAGKCQPQAGHGQPSEQDRDPPVMTRELWLGRGQAHRARTSWRNSEWRAPVCFWHKPWPSGAMWPNGMVTVIILYYITLHYIILYHITLYNQCYHVNIKYSITIQHDITFY